MDRTTPAPEDLAREIAARIASPAPPDRAPPALPGDAWERRLLVALADHVPRQRWVAGVVEQRLSGSARLLASDGAFGHPEAVPQKGVVPTLPEWSYFFHGCGCCLTHKDGTSIDVDFDEHGADGIDPFFYAQYLGSLPAPTGVEALLRQPAPFAKGWMADLEGLRALGFIDGQHRFRITDAGYRWAEALGPFVREMAAGGSERRRLLATVLVDYAIAVDAAESPDEGVEARARDAVAVRAAKLARGGRGP